MPCNCGNPNCPNAQRTAGMVGYPPTDPGPVGADSPLENIQARGYYRGWLQGNTGNPLDVAGPGNLPADKYAAFTESWKQGFTQGVADIGTGTRVCSVENIQNALIAGGADITADGDWGKETQAAFDAAGLTCAQLVPSCTTCPGSYTPGTGTTPGTTHPGTGTTPVVGTAPPAAPKAAVWPWIVGGVALAGAVGYALMATKPTPATAPKKNPASRRRRRR